MASEIELTQLSATTEGYVAEITAPLLGKTMNYRIHAQVYSRSLRLVSVDYKLEHAVDYIELLVAGADVDVVQLSEVIPVEVLNYATARMAEKYLRKTF